ncbi:hypothetical protein FB45DRAFT_1031962 [Roridomyces roridus]|uniref:Uncharacterized protein n=1 Tax=Roridomyces roridus TaxID=1738132 RepID=A0AAD7BJ27_9AGAR|nr:hypothetical protein FB45DRAFT_1031962 [Roridomyces roridus]
MPDATLVLMLVINVALLAIVLASHWDRILGVLHHVYAALLPWLNTSTLHLIYGPVILYLLLPAGNPPQQRQFLPQQRILPRYDVQRTLDRHSPGHSQRSVPPVPNLSNDERRRSQGRRPSVSHSEELEQREVSAWDSWPDGEFTSSFPPEQMHLLTYRWIYESKQVNRGSDTAVDSRRGKQAIRRCLGVLSCSSPECRFGMHIAPEDSLKGIERQLKSTLVVYGGGVIFTNHGVHKHPRYTHHLRRDTELRELTPEPSTEEGEAEDFFAADHLAYIDGGTDDHEPQSEINPPNEPPLVDGSRAPEAVTQTRGDRQAN